MDIDEIKREITNLENGDTTYGACERLSILYNVRNNLVAAPEVEQERYSFDAQPTSEFMKAAAGAPREELLQVMDEHMQVIELLHPKEYAAVISKIQKIKG